MCPRGGEGGNHNGKTYVIAIPTSPHKPPFPPLGLAHMDLSAVTVARFEAALKDLRRDYKEVKQHQQDTWTALEKVAQSYKDAEGEACRALQAVLTMDEKMARWECAHRVGTTLKTGAAWAPCYEFTNVLMFGDYWEIMPWDGFLQDTITVQVEQVPIVRDPVTGAAVVRGLGTFTLKPSALQEVAGRDADMLTALGCMRWYQRRVAAGEGRCVWAAPGKVPHSWRTLIHYWTLPGSVYGTWSGVLTCRVVYHPSHVWGDYDDDGPSDGDEEPAVKRVCQDGAPE